jgi:hypothetical protein
MSSYKLDIAGPRKDNSIATYNQGELYMQLKLLYKTIDAIGNRVCEIRWPSTRHLVPTVTGSNPAKGRKFPEINLSAHNIVGG